MPVTAKDFKIYNNTPEYTRQLDQAFDYFRAKFPDGADAALQYLRDTGKAFMNNGPGNPFVATKDVGADLYGHFDGHDVILWNPETGILVTVDGKVTGIQSAADGLAHEIWGHALNPANDAMGKIPDAQYVLANEHFATDVESTLNAVFFSEPLRDSWQGQLVWTSDVTAHTIMGEDGELTLVRAGPDGHDQYGPQIDYNSPGWQNLQHAFDLLDAKTADGTGSDDGSITEFVWNPGDGSFDIHEQIHSGDPSSGSGENGNGGDSVEFWGQDTTVPGDGSGPGHGRNRDAHEASMAPIPGLLTDAPAGGAHSGHVSLVGVPHFDGGMHV